jgi:two-component system chemotaxis response regulator CheB
MTQADASISEAQLASRAVEAIAIGASAGGIRALLTLFSGLPATFRLPLFVVIHLPPGRDSKLSELFQERLQIPVRLAADKEPVAPGTLFFAGPDYHLSIEKGRTFSLSGEEPVNYSRPSIDLLMESAADVYGAGLVGILLTGANFDGAAGLARIKQLGGLTVVQDPAEAEAPTMPKAAIRKTRPDFILNLCNIQSLLLKLDDLSK